MAAGELDVERLLERLDWAAISDEGLWTVKRIAMPLAAGCSTAEVAAALRKTPSWVNVRLGALREELRSIAAGQP